MDQVLLWCSASDEKPAFVAALGSYMQPQIILPMLLNFVCPFFLILTSRHKYSGKSICPRRDGEEIAGSKT